jgi:glycosyltransferase involved in cell wall biosynthesis
MLDSASARQLRPLRVTFVLPVYPRVPIGGFRVVYEHANQLVARGHTVTVVHTSQRQRPGVVLSKSPLRVLRRGAGRLRDRLIHPPVRWQAVDRRVRLRYVPSLDARWIPSGDCVVATLWWTAGYVATYPRRCGEKIHLIQQFETFDGPEDAVVATWHLPTHKIVISRWLYDKGLELGIAAGSLRLIPYGLDHATFRILWPFSERPAQLAMLYNPAPHKGAADGIHALELAHDRHPEMTAALFGVGAPPPNLPTWIRYYRDPAQRDLVHEIYNQSRVYLCPSYSEGWHLPPAEAMACGCAVVSTDIPGVRDYAEDGQTALLAPPGDPIALADRLGRLLDDPELAARIARAGHEVIEPYTWERAAEQLEAYLLETVARAATGAGRVPSEQMGVR